MSQFRPLLDRSGNPVNRSFTAGLKLALSSTFLIVMVVLLVWFKLTQPRVLILHSYDMGYEWVRDIDIGLKRVLDSKLRYRVHTHYMDVKNHPDRNSKRKAALLARRAVDNWNSDLIIAMDDDAQEYVVKDFVDKKGVSVVFGGLNGGIEPYGYDKAKNATGILERKPWLDLRIALLAMRSASSGKPLGNRIMHIGDISGSVALDNMQMRAFDWAPLILVDSVLATTFDDWKAAIADAANRADIILISNYRAIYRQKGKPEVVNPKEISKWTLANATVPLVEMSGFFVEEGGMFAIGSSGFEQGDVSAKMAIKVLDDDVPTQDMAVVMPQQFIVSMRGSAMKRSDVVLPRLYESFARATNNYYD